MKKSTSQLQDPITFERSRTWKICDSFPSKIPLGITMQNFKQIRKHLIFKMHVSSNHVSVKFDMEKKVKNISCLCASLREVLYNMVLSLFSLMA